MIAISAVDKNWAIGNQGHLLISLPEDQKGVFKKYTAGHTVYTAERLLRRSLARDFCLTESM